MLRLLGILGILGVESVKRVGAVQTAAEKSAKKGWCYSDIMSEIVALKAEQRKLPSGYSIPNYSNEKCAAWKTLTDYFLERAHNNKAVYVPYKTDIRQVEIDVRLYYLDWLRLEPIEVEYVKEDE